MSSAPKSDAATYCQIALRPMAAYCAASIVAGFVAYPLWIFLSFQPIAAREIIGVLAMGLLLAGYIAVFALLPSIAALTLVRMTRLRRGFTDTIAGGMIGVLTITLIYQLGYREMSFDDGDLFRAGQYGLAGLAGGLTYWLANGQPRSRRQSHPGGPATADPSQS